MLTKCRKVLRILMMVSLLHLACSAISDVVKDWLSVISRMRTSFTGESWSHIYRFEVRVLKWEDL